NDILENGPSSPWLDWFRVEDWPLSAYDGAKPANYESWWDNRALPEFNHDNPQAREYIMQIAEYWLRQGIDGWRLDVPFEIKAEGFWQEFRERVKAVNSEAYIVGEVWTDARQWLDGTQFDGVMNYLFTGPALAFTAKDNVVMKLVEQPAYFPYPALDAQGYAAKMEELLALYPWEIQLTQLNLLSSHDIARAITVISDDQTSFELAVLLQMTFPGAPSIYYGDEVGLAGAHDPDCRRSFPPASQWNQKLLKLHKELITLRHAHPALRTGTYETLVAEGDTYGFIRRGESEIIVVVVNTGEIPKTVEFSSIEIESELNFVWGTTDLDVSQERFSLPPKSGVIWAAQKLD
ncbi:MAG: alpha-amylase family glycosyl hydrolase, partial [Cyanobacteria bacterium P01_D01_bin.56]